jgi:hypothetical protein
MAGSYKKIYSQRRQAYVAQLRIAGFSFQRILQALRSNPEYAEYLPRYYDVPSVIKDVELEMERISKTTEDGSRQLRTLETERLDALQSAQWKKALEGDSRSGRLVLEIIALRTRVWGINSPKQTTIHNEIIVLPPAKRMLALNAPNELEITDAEDVTIEINDVPTPARELPPPDPEIAAAFETGVSSVDTLLNTKKEPANKIE